MDEPKVYCADIQDKDRVRSVFLASKKSLSSTKSGRPYLALTLLDRTGELEARAWEGAERLDAEIAAGDFVWVDGVAQAWQGKVQLKLADARKVDRDEVDMADFLPTSRYDPERMFAEVRAIVLSVRDAHVRALLLAFLDDPAIGPAFRRAPAAKSIHHSYLGGLCEHTLSVIQLGLRVCDHYPRLDRDLVIAGALLHDIGKVRELRWDQGFEYTDEGRLVGHLVLTTQWIHEKAARIPGFPEELKWHLVHLVAAHHGELTHGSPKVPHTLEALIVHALDELDSRIASWISIIDRDRGTAGWTEFQKLYDRYLFKGPSWRANGAGREEPAAREPYLGPSIYQSTPDAPGAQAERHRPSAAALAARLRELERARADKPPEPHPPAEGERQLSLVSASGARLRSS